MSKVYYNGAHYEEIIELNRDIVLEGDNENKFVSLNELIVKLFDIREKYGNIPVCIDYTDVSDILGAIGIYETTDGQKVVYLINPDD